MEMEAVANIFDRDGDGYIDYKEFVSALRPNRDVSISKPLYSSTIAFVNIPKITFLPMLHYRQGILCTCMKDRSNLRLKNVREL